MVELEVVLVQLKTHGCLMEMKKNGHCYLAVSPPGTKCCNNV